MRPSSLNMLLVQRIESALGVPLAQHMQLANRGSSRPVPPPGAPTEIPGTETATSKADFSQTLIAKSGSQQPFSNIVGTRTTVSTSGVSGTAAADPAASMARPVSTQIHMSSIGRVLLPLLENFPEGAGPLTSSQPLFISAALALRAQLASQSLIDERPGSPANVSTLQTRADTVTAPGSTSSYPLSSPLTSALMLVLKGQIVHSGLFYESHLLKQIQHSPGRLSALHDEPQQNRSLVKDPGPEIEESLRPLVRQQLDLLAGQPIQWQGMIWPGANMQWEICFPPQDDTNGSDQMASPEEKTCLTRLVLQLPHLGRINADIQVKGKHAQLRLEVEDQGLILCERITSLIDRLSAAGLQPGSVTAQHKQGDHV